MRFTKSTTSSDRFRVFLFSAALIFGAAGSASAAGLAQVVHARQEHFRLLGRTLKSLRDHAGRYRPNWTLTNRDAQQIEHLAADLPTWFPPGSGQGHGVKTRARAAIWKNPQEFARAAHALLVRAQGLAQAAADHNRRALIVNAMALGHACGSCHRRFRAHGSWW